MPITKSNETLANETAAMIEELIEGKNYDELADSVFCLFNDTRDGGYFDCLKEFVERLKSYFFIPENSQEFLQDCFYIKDTAKLYRVLDKLHSFIEDVYNFSPFNHSMKELDLYEIRQYGISDEARLTGMHQDYSDQLKLERFRAENKNVRQR